MTRKIVLFCPACKQDRLTRRKRRCFWRGKRDGYGMLVLPDKCYACGHLHGVSNVKKPKQRSKHLRFS